MIDRIELRWINTCKVKARNTDKNWPVQKLSGSLLKFWTGLMDCLWYLFFNWSSPRAQELDILEKKNKPIDERISCIDYINDSLHSLKECNTWRIWLFVHFIQQWESLSGGGAWFSKVFQTFISFSDRANTKLYNLLVSRPEWSIKINSQFQGNIEVFKWS